MNSLFKRHFLGPLLVTLSLVLWEGGIIYLGWPVTLGIVYPVLALSIFQWSGLRAALVSALLVSGFTLYHLDSYGWEKALILSLGALLIAAPSGLLKRSLREQAIEANRLRLLAIDTYNGNRKKALEALEAMDKAMASSDPVEIKKFLTVARIKLADTLTLTGSWHEMAKEKEIALQKLAKEK